MTNKCEWCDRTDTRSTGGNIYVCTVCETLSLLNMVLDDYLETHRDVADVEPTNDEIIRAFEVARECIAQTKQLV